MTTRLQVELLIGAAHRNAADLEARGVSVCLAVPVLASSR